MKATREFNATKELEKIAKKISDNELLFAIYGNPEKNVLSVLTTGEDDGKDIICAIAAILEMSLTGYGDECTDKVTSIILEALKLVQTSKSIAGLKIATEMPKGILKKRDCLTTMGTMMAW